MGSKGYKLRKGIGQMKKVAVLGAVLLLVLGLTGCGESKEAKKARMDGIEQLNAGNYSEAVAFFDQALKEADGIVNSFELDILKYRGEAEYALGNYQEAAHTYGILLEVDNEKPEYLYYQAAANAMQGNTDSAIESYNQAEQMEQKTNRNVEGATFALLALGSACEKNRDFDQAMEFYKSAVDLGGTTAQLCNKMGLCMVQAKKYEQALDWFLKGISLNDEAWNKTLKYNEGTVYEYQGNFEKALETFKTYMAEYGSTKELEREITFIESRMGAEVADAAI